MQFINSVKIIDVELSDPLSDIDGLEDYSMLQILVRLFSRPIGYVYIPLDGCRCSSGKISKVILQDHSWTIIQHLVSLGLSRSLPRNGLKLESILEMTPPDDSGEKPLVTVAVCTRNRTDSLAKCLDSVNRIKYPYLEIIVIDNAPDSTETMRLVSSKYPDVRYVYEPRPGLNWARNRAVVEASGDIIAYTDDDVLVDPCWVNSIVQVFSENPEVMAVTGLVVPYEIETDAQLLFEQYGGFGCGFERKWFHTDRHSSDCTVTHYGAAGMMGTGANMAYRRELFERIGCFDKALDVGTVTNGGGDLEMFFRVLHNGFTLVYEPAAIVYHCHRRDLASFRTQITNNGIGFSAYLFRCAAAYPSEGFAVLRFWLWWLKYWHCGRLVKSIFGKEKYPLSLILAEFRGYLTGIFRYGKALRKAAEIKDKFADTEITVTPGMASIET